MCQRLSKVWNDSTLSRSSHRRCFVRKVVLRNFAKFTGKHLRQSLFFNKVAGLWPTTLFKKDSGTDVFLWILQNFKEHVFYITPLGDCFSVSQETVLNIQFFWQWQRDNTMETTTERKPSFEWILFEKETSFILHNIFKELLRNHFRHSALFFFSKNKHFNFDLRKNKFLFQ